jgi:hypothetical protein
LSLPIYARTVPQHIETKGAAGPFWLELQLTRVTTGLVKLVEWQLLSGKNLIWKDPSRQEIGICKSRAKVGARL